MPEISGMIQQFLEGNIKTLSAEPVIESKTITENGTYTAPEGVDGYSPVVVNVPSDAPVIESKTITENGTYTPESGVDGYSPVIVNVPPTEPVIESKNISENGTYTAPEGVDGYSPVIVNVPLPENAYLLKSVANLPQAIASFSDGAVAPMMSLKVAIEPQQEGSGDPSPTNVRPISGWDKVNVTVADDTTDPTTENVYTIDLDGTRYGGTLDVGSGVLVVDRKKITFNNDLWTVSSSNVYLSITDGGEGEILSDILSNGNTSGKALFVPSNNRLYVWNAVDTYNITTREEAQTFFNNHTLVYYLATPLTIQLTPTAVKSLLGDNKISADTGDITDAEYFSKEV